MVLILWCTSECCSRHIWYESNKIFGCWTTGTPC